MIAWGHTDCDAYWRLELTECPRHPGVPLREVDMAKITRLGGVTDATLSGLTDDTEKTKAKAKAKDATVTPETAEATATVQKPSTKAEPPFDPAEMSVADVLALLKDCNDTERDAVLEAERGGKARNGILGK